LSANQKSGNEPILSLQIRLVMSQKRTVRQRFFNPQVCLFSFFTMPHNVSPVCVVADWRACALPYFYISYCGLNPYITDESGNYTYRRVRCCFLYITNYSKTILEFMFDKHSCCLLVKYKEYRFFIKNRKK